VGIKTNKSSVSLAAIPLYWYETGPRVILDKYEEERLFELMDVAVKRIYNPRLRNYDIHK